MEAPTCGATSPTSHDGTDVSSAYTIASAANPTYASLPSWTTFSMNWNASVIHEEKYMDICALQWLNGPYIECRPADEVASSLNWGTIPQAERCYDAWGWNEYMQNWGPGSKQSCMNSVAVGGGRITATSDRNGSAFVRVYNGTSLTLQNTQLTNCAGAFIGGIGNSNTTPGEVESGSFGIGIGCYTVWWWENGFGWRGLTLGIDG